MDRTFIANERSSVELNDGRGFFPVFAKIRQTHLGIEDHGCFTVNLDFDYTGSCGQGIGHLIVDDKPEESGGLRRPTVLAGALIAAILRVVGADTWESLPGRHVVVLRDAAHSSGKIVGLAPGPGVSVAPLVFADVFERYRVAS